MVNGEGAYDQKVRYKFDGQLNYELKRKNQNDQLSHQLGVSGKVRSFGPGSGAEPFTPDERS